MNKLVNKKEYLVIAICLLLVFCLASMLLTTCNTAKANAQDDKEFEKLNSETSNEAAKMNESYYSEEDYDYAYIDYQGDHILPNQNFVVPFVVNSEKIIIDFSYTQNGFEVLSTSIINNKQLNFELCCIPNSNEYWLSLQITLNSYSEVNAKL